MSGFLPRETEEDSKYPKPAIRAFIDFLVEKTHSK